MKHKPPFPEPTTLADYKPRPGDTAMMFEGQADGAIPNGTPIVKAWCEPGDANPVGTKGTVLASHRVNEVVGYFVEWETYPGVPVFCADKKIARA